MAKPKILIDDEYPVELIKKRNRLLKQERGKQKKKPKGEKLVVNGEKGNVPVR